MQTSAIEQNLDENIDKTLDTPVESSRRQLLLDFGYPKKPARSKLKTMSTRPWFIEPISKDEASSRPFFLEPHTDERYDSTDSTDALEKVLLSSKMSSALIKLSTNTVHMTKHQRQKRSIKPKPPVSLILGGSLEASHISLEERMLRKADKDFRSFQTIEQR